MRGQWPSLVRYATVLCGDAVEAEELVQTALVRVTLRWPFVRDKDDPGAYVKRAIVHANINRWRRRAVARDCRPTSCPSKASRTGRRRSKTRTRYDAHSPLSRRDNVRSSSFAISTT